MKPVTQARPGRPATLKVCAKCGVEAGRQTVANLKKAGWSKGGNAQPMRCPACRGEDRGGDRTPKGLDIAEVIRRYRAGCSTGKIAAALGVSRQNIHQILGRHAPRLMRRR